MFGSNPSTGADSFMSSARPWGRPSMMSISTTSSARPFCTTRMAVVAPTKPLPTMVTFMARSSSSDECSIRAARSGSGARRRAVALLRAERPLELVPALHERPSDRAREAVGLQVPVGRLDRGLVDQVARVHVPGERHRDLERAVGPHGRELLEVRLDVVA